MSPEPVELKGYFPLFPNNIYCSESREHLLFLRREVIPTPSQILEYLLKSIDEFYAHVEREKENFKATSPLEQIFISRSPLHLNFLRNRQQNGLDYLSGKIEKLSFCHVAKDCKTPVNSLLVVPSSLDGEKDLRKIRHLSTEELEEKLKEDSDWHFHLRLGSDYSLPSKQDIYHLVEEGVTESKSFGICGLSLPDAAKPILTALYGGKVKPKQIQQIPVDGETLERVALMVAHKYIPNHETAMIKALESALPHILRMASLPKAEVSLLGQPLSPDCTDPKKLS